jgi:hypothetical protein
LSVAWAGFNTGAAAGLRALGIARRSLKAQICASTFYLIGGVTGGALGGARGSAWGAACATFSATFVWWFMLRRGIRERKQLESALSAERQEVPEMRSI